MKFAKSLLLIVDVQQGVMNEFTQPVVSKINRLIKNWEKYDWPVVCSLFINLPGSNWERLRDWHAMRDEPEILPPNNLQINTPYIFQKSTYSAWSSEVSAVCETHNIRDIVIVGIDINECVLATALGVFDAGFTPWIITDCCASTGGSKPFTMALTLLKALLGEQQVITGQELLSS